MALRKGSYILVAKGLKNIKYYTIRPSLNNNRDRSVKSVSGRPHLGPEACL